jgi:FkbM family methyltransferase
MSVYIEQCRLSNGLVIHSDSRTPGPEICRQVYREHIYSPPGFPCIKPNQVVIDIGANIGVFALYAANISPTVRVYAFEPASRSFAVLERNVRANNLANVQCYRYSVSQRSGIGSLYVTNTGSTADTMIASRIPSAGIMEAEQVECLSLKDLFVHCRIEKCHFLKVDVEGSEFDIFAATPYETLQKIEMIALEYHEMGCAPGLQLADLFRRSGFRVEIKPEPHSDRGMIYAVRENGSMKRWDHDLQTEKLRSFSRVASQT